MVFCNYFHDVFITTPQVLAQAHYVSSIGLVDFYQSQATFSPRDIYSVHALVPVCHLVQGESLPGLDVHLIQVPLWPVYYAKSIGDHWDCKLVDGSDLVGRR